MGPRWRRGYDALPRLWRSAENEAPDSCPVTLVDARVAGRRAAVVRGRANAERFYDGRRVHRASAVPLPLAALLFGRGAVHGTDGAQHRHRKGMFLDLLDDAAVAEVVREARLCLDRALDDATASALHVHELLQEVYGGAVMAWAGIDLDEDGLRLRSRQLGAVVDGFGFQRGSVLRAVRARRELDRWATTLVRRARNGGAAGTVVDKVADRRGEDGALLPAKVAGSTS